MDLDQLWERLRAIVEEQRALMAPPDNVDNAEDWEPAEEAYTRFDELDTEADGLRTKITDAERRRDSIAASTALLGGDDAGSNRGRLDPPNVNTKGDAYDLSTLRFDVSAQDLRARAETAIEKDDTVEDWVKKAAVATLRNVRDSGQVANLFLHTGSKAYRSGFAKLAAGAHWALDDAERMAVARAQASGNASGGFAVPFTLDPTIILTNDSAINPFRRLGRVVQITTDSWNGVSSAGATASFDAEASEVSDDAIVLAQPSVPVHTMRIFVPFSIEIGGDWMNIQNDLRMAMVDARDRLEANKHAKGTGSGEPTGIEVALDGTASELAPATAETFAAADVYATQRALPPRYRPSRDVPVWVGNLGTASDIRQFDTGGGGNFWASFEAGTPERLLGWRWEEASEIDDSPDINPAVTEQNFILFNGDWSRFLIVDRIGMQIEMIPHLFHTTTNRPSGQRGLFGWLRTGANVIDANAFRVLSIPTTL